MNEDLSQRIAELEAKMDKVYESSEKMRKYFLWTLIVTVVLFVLPLLAIIPAMNSFMDTYQNIDSLGL